MFGGLVFGEVACLNQESPKHTFVKCLLAELVALSTTPPGLSQETAGQASSSFDEGGRSTRRSVPAWTGGRFDNQRRFFQSGADLT